MKIYTRKGDDGRTHLASGERVLKSSRRVELYGAVDELNSVIGAALAWLKDGDIAELHAELTREQNLLFELGSELAGFGVKDGESVIFPADTEALERGMDRMSESLEPMRAFILPGGSPASAFLHIARTVCRRLERMLVAVREGDAQNQDEAGKTIVLPEALRYINRLSDYLFVAARYANFAAGQEDVKWSSRAKQLKKSGELPADV
jgi:cob(I)alamin adenosyltransferase